MPKDLITTYCVPDKDLSKLSPYLKDMLLRLSDECSFPLILTSAFRSTEYELSKGRSGSSSHCKGLAVDVACVASTNRFELIRNAFFVGFKRIGIGKDFIHLDIDVDKPKCIWLY